MYHKLIVVAAIASDPEVRSTPSGVDVANFNVALSIWRGGDNYDTAWIRVTAWRELAKAMGNYGKRDRVVLELTFDKLEEYEGKSRMCWTLQAIRKEIGADQIISSGGNYGNNQPPRNNQPTQQQHNQLDDDIPF